MNIELILLKLKESIKYNFGVDQFYTNYIIKKDKNTPFKINDIVLYNDTQYRIIYISSYKNRYELSSLLQNLEGRKLVNLNEITHATDISNIILRAKLYDSIIHNIVLKHTNGNYYTFNYYNITNVNNNYILTGYNVLNDNDNINIKKLNICNELQLLTNEDISILEEHVLIEKAQSDKRIELLKKALYNIYPETSWFGLKQDANINNLNYSCNCKYIAIIHFPKFTIINENDDSHEINDLFIKIEINEDGLILGELYGVRTTLSLAEYDYKYGHSHMSHSNNDNKWNRFCLGTTDIFQMLIELTAIFNLLMFEALLYRLKDYVLWESLAGGPYKKIENITINNGITSYKPLNSMDKSYIINNIKLLPLQIKKNKYFNTILVDRNNLQFEIHCANTVKSRVSNITLWNKNITTNEYFVNNNDSPEQLNKRITNINNDLRHSSPLTFKGEQLFTQVSLMTTNNETLENSSIVNVLEKANYDEICDMIDIKLTNYFKFKTIYKEYEKYTNCEFSN